MEKLLKKYYELLDNGLLMDFLETEVKEVVKNTYTSTLTDWYHHIILSKNGLYITSPLSQGSSTIGCFNGTEILLAKIPSSQELEVNLRWEDILNVGTSIEERFQNAKLMLEQIINKDEVQQLKIKTENNNQKFDILTCLNNYDTYIFVEEIFKNLFPDKWEDIVNDQIKLLWDMNKNDIKTLIAYNIEVYAASLLN